MVKFLRKKVFYIISTLAILTGCLFILFKGGTKVKAAVSYNLYVANVEITSDNLVINSSDTSAVKSGSATFDPETTTLTLNGFTYEGDGYIDFNGYGYKSYGAIYYYNKDDKPINLTVELVGTNKINSTFITDNADTMYKNSEHFIYIRNNWQSTLTIDGSGSLTCRYKTAGTGLYSIGLECPNIVINGGTIDVSTLFGDYGNYGIKTTHFTMNGGTLRTACDTQTAGGICINSTDITINGGTITATAPDVDQCDGLYADKNIIINGGEVTAIGQFPIVGVINNKMSGTSWTDLAGTKKPRTIEANINQDLSNLGYKRIYFVKLTDPVTITAGTGIKSVYLSTSQDATSGSASGTEFDSGSTVYGFVELAKGYSAINNWTKVSGTDNAEGAKYLVGSVSAGSSNFGTISAALSAYSITYELNGGTHGNNHPSSYTINTETFTITDPKKTGYTFDGWSGTGIDGKIKSLSIAKGSIGDRTLTANWTVDTFTIAFKPNASDATGTTASVTASYNTSQTLPTNGFSRVGYDFKGWSKHGLDEVDFEANATLTAEDVNSMYNYCKKNGTYNLFAVWTYVEEIQNVVDKFMDIYQNVEYTAECKAKIEELEAAYEALSDDYKGVLAPYYPYFENIRSAFDDLASDAVDDVIDEITEINNSTIAYPGSKAAIEGAEAAYNSLVDSDKALITNYSDLTAARNTFDGLRAAAILDVKNKIDNIAIPLVYPTSAEEISAARSAYEALDDSDKNETLITNYQDLLDIEAVYQVVTELNAITTVEDSADFRNAVSSVRTNYNNLSDTQKTLFPETAATVLENYEAAIAVMDKINKIGTVAYTATSKALIDDANNLYIALNDTQKGLVANYSTLSDAYNLYYDVDNVVNLIDSLNIDYSKDCKDAIDAARSAYNVLTDAEKTIFPEAKLQALVDAEKAYDVMDAINAIGTVINTEDCKKATQDARAAYELLNNTQKALVLNYKTLTDDEAVFAVIDKVNAIKYENTEDCLTRIQAARAAYELLDDDQQDIFPAPELKKIEDSEDAFAVMQKIDAIGVIENTEASRKRVTDARAAYDLLEDDQEALVLNYKTLTDDEASFEAVDEVESLIKAIDPLKYPDSKDSIDAARKAYNELTPFEQGLVSNYADLVAKETAFNNADNVVNLINAIGTVKYPDSEDEIKAAREAYDKLTAEEKNLVGFNNLATLAAAEGYFKSVKDSAFAEAVMDKIDAIAPLEITDACKDKIDAARLAYNGLTDDQKALVENYEDLTKAEADYAAAKPVVDLIDAIGQLDASDDCQDAIDDAREAYDLLEADQKALVNNYKELTDKEAAKPVVDQIAEITAVEPTAECQKAVDDARLAYNGLTEDQKALVTNKDNLFNAEDAKEVADLIEAIKPVEAGKDCQDAIDKAKEALEELNNAAKALVANKDDLTNIEAAKPVVDQIAKITAVEPTTECQKAIDDARKEFDDLTEAQQGLVSNIADLEAAEAAKAALDKINAIGEVTYPGSKDAIDTARSAYNGLDDAEKALLPEDAIKTLEDAEKAYKDLEDATKASDVEDLIDEIGKVTYPGSKDAIDAARAAYDALSDEGKALVDEDILKELTDAEALFNAVDNAVKAIDAIGEVKYPDSKDAIDAARKAYDALSDEGKALVDEDTLKALTDAEDTYQDLLDHALADAATQLINAIGKVKYPDSKEAIEAARDAYDKLTDTQKDIVGYDNYAKLVQAEGTLSAQKDLYFANNVKNLIKAIAPLEISDACKARIDAARKAYDDEEFTDEQRLLVTNYADLEKAETDYKAAKEVVDLIEQLPETVLTARTKYDALTDDQKALVNNYNKLLLAEASKTDTLIDAIGTVVYTKDCKEAIDAARKEYDSLTPEQKAVVKKLAILEEAEDAYAKLKAAAIQDAITKITSIGTVAYTPECKNAIDAARSAFDKVLEADQTEVTNKQVLLDAEAAYNTLKTDHEAAAAVDEKINAIGTVAYTPESKALIDAAKEAYNALAATPKGYVTKLDVLNAADALYNAVDGVVTKINAIVSPLAVLDTTTQAISEARTAYNALTDGQKAIMPAEVLAKLGNIEAAYAVMQKIEAIKPFALDDECKARIDAAKEAYGKLDDTQKALVANADELSKAEADYDAFIDGAKAQEVDTLIDEIGTVAYSADCNTKIVAARKAYDDLTKVQQALVTKLDTLTSAENTYKSIDDFVKAVDAIEKVELTDASKKLAADATEAYLKIDATNKALIPAATQKAYDDKVGAILTMDAIAKIGDVAYTATCKEAIDAAKAVYEGLSDDGKALVANIDELTDANNAYNAVDAVVKKIADITEPLVVSDETSKAISDARLAYDALDKKLQALVPADDLTTLVNYEAAYAVMELIEKIPTQINIEDAECMKAINDARSSYNALTEEQQALVTNLSKLTNAEVVVVDLKIDAIGTVTYTATSKAKIDAARLAYDALSDAQKALSKSAADLTTAETAYNTLKTTAVNDAIAKINAIGTVAYTADSLALINAADEAWDKILTDDAELVTNLAVLEKAITDYDALSLAAVANYNDKVTAIGDVEYTNASKEKIDAARLAYEALVGEDKTNVTNLSTLTTAEANYATARTQAISNAITKIDAIGEVAYTDACKALIDAARSAFNAVLEADQAEVTNYADLTAAETAYSALAGNAIADVIDKIDAIGEVAYTDASKELLDAANTAYNALVEGDDAAITNADTLTAANTAYDTLKNAAIADTISKIDAIGEVAYTDASKALLDAANDAYDALVEGDEAAITNADTLTAANTAYDTLKNAAIANAITKINAIGTVEFTNECKDKIDAARSAFNAVLEADQAEVTNIQTLIDAEAAYAKSKADHEAADAAVAKINAIGVVEYTNESKEKIDAARKAYDGLTADQKALVKDADKQTLENAEAAYAKLIADHEAADAAVAKIKAILEVEYTDECKNQIDAARKAYNALTDDQKELVTNLDDLEILEDEYAELKADHDAADAAIAKIKAIGTVTYTNASKEKIDAARKAYDDLTSAQKQLVNNDTLKVLTDAENLYAKLEADNTAADAVTAKINAIGTVTYTPESKALIDAAKEAYNALTDDQKALVKDADKQALTDAENLYAKLEADNNAADQVIAKINAIGTVTYTNESKAKIEAARKAYDGLTADQKALVKNVNTLTEAENLYNKLEADNIAAAEVQAKIKAIGTVAYTAESKALIDAARNAYNALTEDQKALVKDVNTLTGAEAAYNKLKADHDAADAVTAKINAIGTVAYNQQTKAKIDAARTSYDALTSEQKALVKEAEVKALENAEKTYTDVDVAYVKINSIKPVALDDSSKKEIEEAKAAYEKLTDDEKKLLPNYSKLTNSEAQYNKLVEDNKSATTMTIVISSVGVLILIGVVVYMVLFKKKEDK